MGIDADALFHSMAAPLHPETYETLGQAWIWPNKQQQVEASTSAAARTASLKRRSGAQRALRKSCSERPLSSPVRAKELLAAGGSASVLDVEDSATASSSSSSNADEDDEQRRQRITARAEEILRGKRCVGMLVGATCPVCLADDVDTQLSECGHLIHAKCIKRWIQSGTCCPVCREEVVDVEEAFTSPAKGLPCNPRPRRPC
ncbi:RING/U-box superfamily protein [Phytophthora cinnamomi]|uniref:RING/U-box superfamily protein n=1 Tax=Phytophthora cinnamomi TaxID=4785 RepID=UPI00355960FC|nr:RING/U-box superfamily protein [Phytophthora cinnamomi]